MGIFLMGTTEFMIAGLLPATAVDLGVSVARAGLLVTAFAVGMIIGPPVMALATLRLAPRATLVLALAVFAAGHVTAAVSDSFTVVTMSRVVTALATGTFWAVGAVVAGNAAGPGSSARALAVMSGGLSLAVVAGVPLGTFVGQFTGWRGPFWLLAGLSLPAILAVLRFAPATRGNDRPDVSVRGELAAVRPWRVWALLATMVLFQAGFLGAYSYISPLLTDLADIPAGFVPLVLVGFGIGALIGTAVGGRLGDRRPSAVAGATLSGSWELIGPAALGAVLTGSALFPLALLALKTNRTLRSGEPTAFRGDGSECTDVTVTPATGLSSRCAERPVLFQT
jgi:DHA1 family inner membrane transport protein